MVTDKVASSNELEIFKIGKSRQRSVYYRKDGSPTGLLPSDAISRVYYSSKGYRLKPEKEPEKIDLKCTAKFCDFVAKDVTELVNHLQKHAKNAKKEE